MILNSTDPTRLEHHTTECILGGGRWTVLDLVNKRSSTLTWIVCPATQDALIFSNKPIFFFFLSFCIHLTGLGAEP